MKRNHSGSVILVLFAFIFLHSTAAWSAQDLGVTPSGLINRIQALLDKGDITTARGEKIVIGDVVEMKNKTGATIFTSVVNKDLVLSGVISAQSGNLENLFLDIALPEGTENVRLENASWLHGFFSSLVISFFSADAAEYQSAADLYRKTMEDMIKDDKAEAQLNLKLIKIAYYFSGEGMQGRLKTVLTTQ